MNRHVVTLAGLVLTSGLLLGQPSRPSSSQEPSPPVSRDEHKHLSKKEKKALKKERDHERKEEKKRLKHQAEERRKYDKQREKELAKQRKRYHDRDRKKDEKEIAKQRRDERQHEEKQEAREARHDPGQPSMTGRAAGAAGSVAAAPFRVARYATPRLLRAQKDVSHAIYAALPASNVAVLLNDAGQIVLRGAAPTPSLRSTLLQLAMGSAGGYPIVDQLAANFVGDAASAAANAAMGGVSDMIHGRSKDDTPDVPPTAPSPGQYSSASPAADTNAIAAIEPGTSACVNVSTSQVLLTGQASSSASADMLRRFARQLGGASASLNDQLATRNHNVAAPTDRLPDGAVAADSAAAAVTPGSGVCVNVSDVHSVLLSGTVGSPTELSAVEQAAQPLVAGARLSDQLTIGSLGTGTQVAAGVSQPSNTAIAATNPPSATGLTAEESTLQQTMHAIPRLSNVDVTVTADTVRLNGSVDTPQDGQMARDIARQHAPGISIVDNLSVAGRPAQEQ